MDLFHIINMPQIKKQYGIESFNLVDFTVGFNDLIYLLFMQTVPERIGVIFVNTIPNTRYAAITVDIDWDSHHVIGTRFIDLNVLEFNYHFIRPIENSIMLIGARCYYHNENNIEQNVLLLNEKGKLIRKLCFGDGIQDCITTADGKIIVSYFDEGVFGNYGWKKPLGSSGLVIWDSHGNIQWENRKYNIFDCYAMNIDSSNRLWFFYYDEFDLVCTNFAHDTVFHPDISGSGAFALSKTQQNVLFSGGYNDPNFYECNINFLHGKIENKHALDFKFHNQSIGNAIHHFSGSKLLFLINDDLCGFYYQ